MKTLVIATMLMLFPVSLSAEEQRPKEGDVQVEEVEDCGAPYHIIYEYRQFREYTRPYYILVDSCGNELSYTLNPPGVYVEL